MRWGFGIAATIGALAAGALLFSLGSAPIQAGGPLVKSFTQDTALDLFVDPTGNNANGCTATGTAACADPDGAELLIPPVLTAAVTMTLAPGTYNKGAYVRPKCQPGGSLVIKGTNVTSTTLASGTATGTFTAAAAISTSTLGTATDSGQAWTAHDLKGKLVQTTTAATVQYIRVTDNTSTVLTYTADGPLATALTSSTTYVVLDQTSVINGNVASFTNNESTSGNTSQSAAFIIDTPDSYMNDGCVTIQDLRITGTTVTKAFHIQSGFPTIQRVQVDSSSNIIAIQSVGNGGVRSLLNYETTTGTSFFGAFFLGYNGSAPRDSYFGGNVYVGSSGGGGFIQLFGAGHARSQYNSAVMSTSVGGGAFIGLQAGTVTSLYDHSTGNGFCLNVSQSKPPAGTMGTGTILVDGLTCNDPVTDFFRVLGPTYLELDVGGVASSGTNANSVPLYLLSNGARVLEDAATNFTESGSGILLTGNASNVTSTIAAFRAATPAQLTDFNSLIQERNTTGTMASMLGNLLVLGSAKNKGLITLSSGTGTATVSSGAICTCSETTDATKTFKCPVSGTTLTATGTGSDVISYHCF